MKKMTAVCSFEAAAAAHQGKDYGHSLGVLVLIDPNLLTPEHKARRDELMAQIGWLTLRYTSTQLWPSCLSRSATPLASLARTISATATNFCQRHTVSTNSMAIFTT